MDNMEFHCKYPNPPKFKNVSDKDNFEVPKYYGFDHPCTKWILGSIVSNQALFRLMKVATNYQCILKRYHQIPDRPNLIMKDQYNAERAAFDSQAILYLTPLAISIYMKYEDALTQLVELKDANGITLIDPNELCFVQNFWRKGDTRYFTDLIATFPAIIAIRRNYFEAFRYLLIAGYCPNDSFSITYRKPHREIIILYKDLIDYVMDYLKRRPAFNVSKLMNVLLQTSVSSANNLDIFCFDYLPGSVQNLISMFQRITRTLLDEDNLSEENGMHIINILEKIQEAGFFIGMRHTPLKTDSRPMDLEELLNQKQTKIKIGDLQKLKGEILENLLKNDYNYCIANLIIWLQTKVMKRKTEQTSHLIKLLVKIMFDTELIELFFKSSCPTNEDLLKKLSLLPNLADLLEIKTVTILVNHVIQFYQQSGTMITNFISRYKSEPTALLLGHTELVRNPSQVRGNKTDLIKSELAEQAFRTKYLKCKEESSKQNRNANRSNSVDNYRERIPLDYNALDYNALDYNASFQIEKQVDPDNKFQTNTSHSDQYFYVSSKSQKCNSNVANHFYRKTNRKAVNDSSIDMTTDSIRSLVALDVNDTISISNIFDLNNLTTIEIDLAEVKKSKRMCTEVVITGADEEWFRKDQMISDLVSSSTYVTNTLKDSDNLPPPLKEHKTKHYKIK